MLRDDDPVRRSIKTAIAFVMRGIAKEDTQGGARNEFVGSSGRKVGIAPTTKNTEMLIGWLGAIKDQMRSREIECFGWENIKEGSSAECLNPVARWYTSLK